MKINILGVQIDPVTHKQALEKANEFLNFNGQRHIITANPEMVLHAWQNGKYRQLINNSALVTPDGIGLIWAGKFLSLESDSIINSLIQAIVAGFSLIINSDYCYDVFPERVAGVDLLDKICELAARSNKKVYLLGGGEGIAKKTAEILKKQYLNLLIVGAEAGPMIEEAKISQQDTKKNQETIYKIQTAEPDLLFVAFGAPKQEYWIKENLPSCPSVKVAMGVGGAFDFISGKTKRAPQIYRDLNLEWLHRLIYQPWRALRIFNATAAFAYYIIKFKHKAKS